MGQAKIIKLVDISYGGENGVNQAIELSAEVLSNVKFIQEKKLIGRYFDEISQDTGKFCYGVDDTMKALEMGAVETLIIWENLGTQRIVLKNHNSEEDKVEMEVLDKVSLIEWLANNYKAFGAYLEIVTDRSSEGSQFCRGFGGIGGLLRYKVDFQSMEA